MRGVFSSQAIGTSRAESTESKFSVYASLLGIKPFQEGDTNGLLARTFWEFSIILRVVGCLSGDVVKPRRHASLVTGNLIRIHRRPRLGRAECRHSGRRSQAHRLGNRHRAGHVDQ